MNYATLSPVSPIVNVFNDLNRLNFHFNSCNPNNFASDVDGFIPGTASRTDTPSHSIKSFLRTHVNLEKGPQGVPSVCPAGRS